MTPATSNVVAAPDPSRRLRAVQSRSTPSGRAQRVLLPNPVLGVLIFLAAEIMLFAGLISAFLILRANADVWPPLGQPRLPVVITSINTAILLISGFTMWRAHVAAGRQSGADLKLWLIATAMLGSLFLLIQGSEWLRLISFGLRVSSGTYGSTFYALIGCHGLHVLVGVLCLLFVLQKVMAGRYVRESAAVQAASVYWAFVVGIWPLLYVLVYWQ